MAVSHPEGAENQTLVLLEETPVILTTESPLQSFQKYFTEGHMIMSLTVEGEIIHGRKLEVIKQYLYYSYYNVHMKFSPETKGEIL